MLFQQINKNSPERIWMVCQNADINGETLVEGNAVGWTTGDFNDIGKETIGLKVTKMQGGVAPLHTCAGIIRKGSKPIIPGAFGIIQVYGFYDGALADGSISLDAACSPSNATPGLLSFVGVGTAGSYSLTFGWCVIDTTQYTALSLGNKVGIFLKCM